VKRARLDGTYETTVRRLDRILKTPLASYRPLPQARLFHISEKKFRFALGGNRSSKSETLAHEVVYYALSAHPWKNMKQGNRVWYATVTWDMVGSILWEKLERILDPYLVSGEAKINWRNRNIKCPNSVTISLGNGKEGRIIFKAYEQGADTFQGTERDFVANDEQFSQAIYLEQISRIGTNSSLSFAAAMTPIKAQPWLQDSLTIAIPDSYDVFKFPLDDNRRSRGGFIPDADIDRLIDEWPEEVQPTRRLGEWAAFTGAVYKSFNRAVHVVNLEREKREFFINEHIIRQNHTIRGLDFGAADPFVVLWGVRIPHMDNAFYIYDEYWWDSKKKGVQRLMRNHADAIKFYDDKWKCPVVRTWADHDRQDRFELQKEGITTIPARKDIIIGIEIVQKALKHSPAKTENGNFFPEKRPQVFISDRCVNTIREFSLYAYPDETEKHTGGDLPIDKFNHGLDCVRYLLASESYSESKSQGTLPIEFRRSF
jgi:phage terminase large subunit-like protein